MGTVTRRLVGLASLALTAPLLVAPAQGAEERPNPRVASQACTVGGVTTGVAYASGRVLAGGSGVNAARVYAYDLETGSVTCVLTASDGTYTAPLPGVSYGGGVRRSAEGWVIAAAAPSGSPLGGASRTLAWNAVTPGATLAMGELALGTATASVEVTVNGQPPDGPALVCVGFEFVQWAGPCAVAPAGSAAPVALATGTATSQSVYAQARASGAWWRGWSTTTTPGTVVVMDLGEEPSRSSQPCVEGQAVRGTVTREVDGVTVGVSADVVAYGLGDAAGNPTRVYLGETVSDRNGQYTLCASFADLPNGTSGVRLVVVANSVLGGVRTVTSMASGCTAGCTGEDVRLDGTPDIGGGATYSGRTGLASQAAFSWWSVSAGFLDGGNPVQSFEVASGVTGPDGTWGLAFADGLNPVPNGSYIAAVRPPNARAGYAETFAAFTSTGSSAALNVSLTRGNFTGQAVAADGSPLAWSWLSVGQVECMSMCVYRGASTDSQGWFSLNLPDGTYEATAYAPWGNSGSVTTTRTLVVSAGSLVSFAGSAPTDPLVFQLQGPNARILVRADGSPLPDTHLSVRRWNDAGYFDWSGDGFTTSSGIAGVRLEPGEYLVTVRHWGDRLVPAAYQRWRVTQSGGDVAIEVCALTGRINGEPCPTGVTTSALTRNPEGDWIVNLPVANLVATVQSPDGDRDLANAEVCLVQEGSEPGFTWSDYLSCQTSNSSGKAAFSLPPSGSYKVVVYPPWDTNEDWVSASFRFRTDSAGAVCSVASNSSCTALSGSTMSLPLSGPNVIATVTGAGGGALTGGWASVQRACDWHPQCREWVTSASVSQSGRLSVKLDASDDTYYLTVHPWNAIDGSVGTTFPIRVTDSDTVQRLSLQLKSPNVSGTITDSFASPLAFANILVEQSTANGWMWVGAHAQTSLSGDYRLLLDPGTYRLRVSPQANDRSRAVVTTSASFTVGAGTIDVDVTMAAPNLIGTVKLPNGSALAGGWIEVQEWFPAYGYYGWSSTVPGAESVSGGRFSLNLPSGQWRLVVNPPWGTLTASRTIVPVRSDGTGVCLDVSPFTTCAADRYLTSAYEVTMESPNVSGQVFMPDGVTEIAYSWIDVQKWTGSQFSWDFDLPSVVTGPRATFALRLPAGRWRLTAHPDGNVVDATRALTDVTVDAGGVCLTSSAPCGPDDAIALGDFDVSLKAPNVTGLVTAGGSAVPHAWAQVEKWNSVGNYWEWTNNYSWTRDTGRYALSVLDDGDYRVRANSGQGVRGYTEGVTYLRALTGEVCELSGTPEPPSAPTCATGLDDSVAVTTALAPSSLVALIRGDGQPVPWTWVQLQERVNGDWNWRQGNHTVADGSVSLNVTTDDSGLFRLRIEPPWGTDVEYVRSYAEFIAYRDGATTRTCSTTDWNASTRTCAAPVSSAAPLMVNLNVGGLRGRVTSPDGSAGIAGTWVQVQKWTAYPWSPGTHGWLWVDAYAHTRQTGNFTLPLEEAGVYQITAYQPWINPSGWSRRTTIVQFDGAGAWCRQDPIAGTGPASGFGACDYAPGLTTDRLVMPLMTSNLVGVVKFNGTAGDASTSRSMPFAWIEVRKTTGEWVASLSSSDQGRFALFLDDGAYAVTAYPNGRFSQRPPVTQGITVSGGTVVAGLTGGELILDVDAIPPNALLTLTGVTGQRLIAVERDANDDTTSVDWILQPSLAASTNGSSPNVAGFVFPAGVYRLTLVPDIGKVVSTGGQVEVVVPASGTVGVTMSATETVDPSAGS